MRARAVGPRRARRCINSRVNTRFIDPNATRSRRGRVYHTVTVDTHCAFVGTRSPSTAAFAIGVDGSAVADTIRYDTCRRPEEFLPEISPVRASVRLSRTGSVSDSEVARMVVRALASGRETTGNNNIRDDDDGATKCTLHAPSGGGAGNGIRNPNRGVGGGNARDVSAKTASGGRRRRRSLRRVRRVFRATRTKTTFYAKRRPSARARESFRIRVENVTGTRMLN